MSRKRGLAKAEVKVEAKDDVSDNSEDVVSKKKPKVARGKGSNNKLKCDSEGLYSCDQCKYRGN